MELNSKDRKKILIFVDWYEPGFKAGGPIRSIVNLVNNLHGQYNFFIFTSDRDLGDTEPYPSVISDTWILKNEGSVFYASPKSLRWKAILREINSISPDYIYLNGMYALHYTIYPLLMKRFNFIKAKIILAPRGMLQEGALQFKSSKKRIFLKILSLLSVPELIEAQATDLQEEKDIYKHLPNIRSLCVLPNFSSTVSPYPLPVQKLINVLKVVFISRVSPKKNLLFFIKLLKDVNIQFKVSLTIVGGIEDMEYWEQCSTTTNVLPENIQIDYTGPLNNDQVKTVLEQHHLLVLPTLGENFGHAIFESLALGRPVLISDKTPWHNLEKQNAGWDISLNNPKSYIDVIERVAAMDEFEFKKWSTGAWQYAQSYAESTNLIKQYEELFS